MTRSPGLKPVTPGPTLSTTPANSPPGENGNGGLVWYLPAMIRVSKKLSPTAATLATTSPAPAVGSGMSASTRSSGVPNPAAPRPAAPSPAATAATGGDAQPTLLGQYGDWGAYTASPGGGKICFALAKPKTSKTEPAGRNRDQSYMFISSRPAENIKN